MSRLSVRHVTTYRYRNPVGFGDHRMMFRPRDSHDLWIEETRLVIDPEPISLRWLHDVFGNSVAVASFAPETRASELRFVSELELDHYHKAAPDYPLEDYALTYPFSYEASEVPDLARCIERHYPDPDHAVGLWARGFVRTDGPTGTWELLESMTRTIRATFGYRTRDEKGTQSPVETLRKGTGSCRDLALLMMEGLRALGFAARFVSGYVFSPGGEGIEGRDRGQANGPAADQERRNVGGGATHAWLQVYLPGAGWVEFDPTNGIVGTRDLIRVAVARDPSQAIPLSGGWLGTAGDALGMSVDVSVTAGAIHGS